METSKLNELQLLGLNGEYFLDEGTRKLKISINNVTELDMDRLREVERVFGAGSNDIIIQVRRSQMKYDLSTYEFSTYIAIVKKMEQLIAGVDVSLPEKQRFRIIYERVCRNITYDKPAAYPKNEAEKTYSDKVRETCRNLQNGLLEGKCVCAGYSDILRNALLMVGIQAEYVSGDIIEEKREIDVHSQKYRKFPIGDRLLECESQKVWTPMQKNGYIYYSGENHAWNKVKLDGIWYNVDATWDSPQIRSRKLPTHCLKTDKQIMEEDNKLGFDGPECVHDGMDEVRTIFYVPYMKKIMDNATQVHRKLKKILKQKAKEFGIDKEDQQNSMQQLRKMLEKEEQKDDIQQI